MKKLPGKKIITYSIIIIVVFGIIYLTFSFFRKAGNSDTGFFSGSNRSDDGFVVKRKSKGMPVYGNWRNFTTKDGLPGDKAYCVRIDGDRVLVGTHEGMAVYENEKWTTYTKEDGLAHNGVLSIDVSKETGDVWIGTLDGLNCWSSGKFQTFTQFNSGLANNLIYCVICDGKDVWVATGGGAGSYDTHTGEWGIYTERNAPMHEPWTYSVCEGADRIFIAAWGGGVIEYNKETKTFRDYVDPDGNMEIDLLPNDGVVHDITTGVSYSEGILWVSTYFGLSLYDGERWYGYFDHDSGLSSNFINFLRAVKNVGYVCSDNGFSTFNGEIWVSYKKDDNSSKGKAIVTKGSEVYEIPMSPCISHNFIIGVDAKDDVVWIATSKGVSRGEIIKML